MAKTAPFQPATTEFAVAPEPAIATAPPLSGKKPFYIPSLDGIRAVSFLLVFASHAITEKIPGGFGVTVFFFLSGYLITTLMRQEHEKSGTIALGAFYARRALRIFPNFYIVLVGAALLTMLGAIDAIGREGLSWFAFAWQALYANNYYAIFWKDYGTSIGTSVFWSLAVEEHFYLLFPAVFLVLHRTLQTPASRAGVLYGLCALVLAWRFIVHFTMPEYGSDYCYKASDARFDAMLYGCALAIVGNPVMDPSRRSNAFWQFVAFPLAIGLILLTFVIRQEHVPWFRDTLRYTLQSAALIPVFVAAIRCHESLAFRWLNWRFVRFFGVLSYTLYLVHLIVILRLKDSYDTSTMGVNLAVATVALAISFGIAAAMHYTVERPLARLRKRLHAEQK